MTDDELDGICEQFEDAWDPSRSGPSEIRNFVSQLGHGLQAQSRLLISLAQIDIELSWITWEKYLQSNERPLDPALLQGKFESLPRASHYFELFKDDLEFQTNIRQLILAEANCRSLFGDSASDLYYSTHYGVELNSVQSICRRQLKCIFQESVGRSDAVFKLHGRCTIGRQRSTDAESVFAEESPEGMRIVIAEHGKRGISREQMALQLISPRYAIVTNMSQSVPLRLGIGEQPVYKELELEYLEAMVAPFPFVANLQIRLLKFF